MRRILLVEDEPDIQLITRYALEDAGYTVVAVNNGTAAIAQLLQQPFDAVLLDVMMPDLDGYATCSLMRANPQTSTMPVIFLTAKAQEDERREGLALGARGYIIKPFDVDTLSDEIERLLNNA